MMICLRHCLRASWVGLLCLSLFVCGGCGSVAIQISLPSRGASRAERLRAYQRYRPTKQAQRRETITYERKFGRILRRQRYDVLMLKSGAEIEDVTVLRGAVLPTSVSARAIRQIERIEFWQETMFWTGIGGAVAGVALIGPALFSSELMGDGQGSVTREPAVWIGALVLCTGVLLFQTRRSFYAEKKKVAERLVLQHYHKDLVARLGLSWPVMSRGANVPKLPKDMPSNKDREKIQQLHEAR